MFGIVPAGESRRARAVTATRLGLAEPADLRLRHTIFSSIGYAGVVLGAGVFGLGGLALALLSDTVGFVPWGMEDVWNLTSGPFGFFCGVGVAAALRARMVQRALTLWNQAGRPEGWRTPRSARPGNRDLVYWLVCGVLLGWLMWASSDVQRADHETWAATDLAASECDFGDTVTFGGTAAIRDLLDFQWGTGAR